MVKFGQRPTVSRRGLRTCSQFNKSLTGAKCDWTPLGSPIFPTHSSRTLTFMLIWMARDLHEKFASAARMNQHPRTCTSISCELRSD